MEGGRLTVSRLHGFSGKQKALRPCVYLDVPGPSVSYLSLGSHHTPRRAAEYDGILWGLGAYRKGELVRKPGKRKWVEPHFIVLLALGLTFGSFSSVEMRILSTAGHGFLG